MDVLYILLFLHGVAGRMVLYQPQNIVSVDVNGTAIITCWVSTGKTVGEMFFWYFKKHESSEAPILVKSCVNDNDTHKYTCKHDGHTAYLEIYHVQITDSGVYYCRFKHISEIFGNGTHLNVGDRSTSGSSIHIVGHLQPLHPHSSLHLACVVLAAHNTVHLHWNISGTHHKGRTISKEESARTWTVVNMISLTKHNWNHEDEVTCEAWLHSSPTSVHWSIPRQGELSHGYVSSKCQNFLIPVVTTGILLLLMFSVHFIRICHKYTDNETPDLMGNNTMTEDEIVYSELNINHLTRFTSQISL
ncbi:uncharacterized protein [Engystomops pustulosus]|uniref:uncharacterized protein n=1 Tax=Engystomops pustulosus TaxID=76066 RepID=UPI003AFB1839